MGVTTFGIAVRPSQVAPSLTQIYIRPKECLWQSYHSMMCVRKWHDSAGVYSLARNHRVMQVIPICWALGLTCLSSSTSYLIIQAVLWMTGIKQS